MARLKDKIQNSLDEARLLILGSQVLLGFQYRSVFEPGFERLPPHSQHLKLAGLLLLLVAIALLIWPGAYHRIVSRGEDTEHLHHFTSQVMEVALLPFAIALAIDLFVAAERVLGTLFGGLVSAAGGLVALTFWYGLELAQRRRHRPHEMRDSDEDEPSQSDLSTKIKHVLTEARVVLPGAQALLGFQFITFLMDAFDKLPQSSKYIHLISLCLIAISVILLMTPAAYHRIVERGEESEHFHRFASRIVLAAMVPLALGMCGDLFIVARKVMESTWLAVSASMLLLILFYGFWFGLTSYWRSRDESERESRGRLTKYERQTSNETLLDAKIQTTR